MSVVTPPSLSKGWKSKGKSDMPELEKTTLCDSFWACMLNDYLDEDGSVEDLRTARNPSSTRKRAERKMSLRSRKSRQEMMMKRAKKLESFNSSEEAGEERSGAAADIETTESKESVVLSPTESIDDRREEFNTPHTPKTGSVSSSAEEDDGRRTPRPRPKRQSSILKNGSFKSKDWNGAAAQVPVTDSKGVIHYAPVSEGNGDDDHLRDDSMDDFVPSHDLRMASSKSFSLQRPYGELTDGPQSLVIALPSHESDRHDSDPAEKEYSVGSTEAREPQQSKRISYGPGNPEKPRDSSRSAKGRYSRLKKLSEDKRKEKGSGGVDQSEMVRRSREESTSGFSSASSRDFRRRKLDRKEALHRIRAIKARLATND